MNRIIIWGTVVLSVFCLMACSSEKDPVLEETAIVETDVLEVDEATSGEMAECQTIVEEQTAKIEELEAKVKQLEKKASDLTDNYEYIRDNYEPSSSGK